MKINTTKLTGIRVTEICIMVFWLCFCNEVNAIVLGGKTLTVRVHYDAKKVLVFDVVNLRSFTSCEEAVAWCWQLHKKTEKSDLWYRNGVSLEFTEGINDQKIQQVCDSFVEGKVYPLELWVVPKARTTEHRLDMRRILERHYPGGIPDDIQERLERLERDEGNFAEDENIIEDGEDK